MNVSDALLNGFSAAVEDNRTSGGGDPFGDFARGESYKFGDRDGEEIKVRGKDGGFVFE
jgi:hypothetical protein